MTVKEGMILFWGGVYSNWYPSKFVVNNVEFNCGEQFMMYEKARLFGDTASMEAILNEPNPREQKALGKKVKNEKGEPWTDADKEKWALAARDLVYVGLLEKFQQNPHLKNVLENSMELEIVEASPTDCIWGIGLAEDNPDATNKSKWKGTNWLGEVIMRVRSTLRAGKNA